jgi:hypothetical protein
MMTPSERRLDRLVPVLAVGVIFLLVICTVLSVVASTTARDAQKAARDAKSAARIARANTDRIDAAVRGGCERLQRLRDDVNVQGDGQYDVIRLASGRVPEPFATLYRRIARETSYSPPTDCAAASDHPLTYKPPPLIPWSQIDKCFNRRHLRLLGCTR